MTNENYTASYDTLGNYEEPVNQTPVARAVPSPLEDIAVNTDVAEMPSQGRKKMPTWKKVLIGGLIAIPLTTSLGLGYGYYKLDQSMKDGTFLKIFWVPFSIPK
jgi:hypothetical protein